MNYIKGILITLIAISLPIIFILSLVLHCIGDCFTYIHIDNGDTATVKIATKHIQTIMNFMDTSKKTNIHQMRQITFEDNETLIKSNPSVTIEDSVVLSAIRKIYTMSDQNIYKIYYSNSLDCYVFRTTYINGDGPFMNIIPLVNGNAIKNKTEDSKIIRQNENFCYLYKKAP